MQFLNKNARVKQLAVRLLQRLPRTKSGDRLFHIAHFIWAHGRIPQRNSGLFNDYLFFLKTDGGLDNVLRQFTSDKELVKVWIEARLGHGFTSKTFVVLNASDLNDQEIPANSVIKPTHLSGFVTFAIPELRTSELQKAQLWMDQNLYLTSREANYKNLKPKLIVEELIADPSEIVDYKVFCFRGEPKIIQVDVGRHSSHRRTLYTADWELLDITYSKPKGGDIPRPALLTQMLSAAKILARDFESLRVDFYLSEGRLLVGELTHCPEQAHGRFGSTHEESHFSEIYFGGRPDVTKRRTERPEAKRGGSKSMSVEPCAE